MLALALIVLPLIAGRVLVRASGDDERSRKSRCGTVVAAATFVMAHSRRKDRVEPALALASVYVIVPFWRNAAFRYWIVLLLALCTLCAILATNVPRQRNFIALMLLLEGTMMGVFLARDLLAFALFWDLMLLPVFFALVGWGEHTGTAWRYFIYNFAGGLALLLATAAFGVLYGSTDVIGRRDVHLVGAWVPVDLRGFRVCVLGEDAGLAAAHVDAADLQRYAAADGCRRMRGAIESGPLRIYRDRAWRSCPITSRRTRQS